MAGFDFFTISTSVNKRGVTEIKPDFELVNPSSHLMIRGGDFYAIWDEEKQLWSTREQRVIELVDQELDRYVSENSGSFEGGARVLYMRKAKTGVIDEWHRYCQKQMRDSFHPLDEKLIFANSVVKKEDYASKKLTYPLEEGETPAWDRLLSVLYSPEEQKKIEWSIGSIVDGSSRKLQKFVVFYGAAGTGKSTIIGIIEKLFEGYTCVFDARSLGSSSNSFALEAFRTNPLVAIQHDGDLSRIEDNTRLNSLVSHEQMLVNEKFMKAYKNKFNSFLFMGTNKPVKITDAKSGLMRRLIDIRPTGEKLSSSEYKQIMKKIEFEYGAIAYKCMRFYQENKGLYDDYIPINMMDASNDFYNFIMDDKTWITFVQNDSTTLAAAWALYDEYNKRANVPFAYPQRQFKEELKNYFSEYYDRKLMPDGTRVRSYYKGFLTDKYTTVPEKKEASKDETPEWLKLKEQDSLFDSEYADCPAQYGNTDDKPNFKWANVKTSLHDIDTHKVHYVKVPENLVCIDFDISDGKEKLYQRNVEEASKWPETYAEVSKSGKAIHLYYIYEGDVSQLSSVYADQIEVKVFSGGSSLRRKLTKCNDIPIRHISTGLPIKVKEKKMLNQQTVKTDKSLHELIARNLRKEIHSNTTQSINFIQKILDDAYESGLDYSVLDMKNAIVAFAAGSTHQSDYCLKTVSKMHFLGKEREEQLSNKNEDDFNVFYDIETFPNFFGINWKIGEDYSPKDFLSWEDYIHELQTNHKPITRMINPSPEQVEEFVNLYDSHLIDFNGRKYDRHMMYGRILGYSEEQNFQQSQRIITEKDKNAMFANAYRIGKTDVLDFASAGNKKSLKALEIEMGFHHQELGYRWDQPVPEEKWEMISQYCDNDVLATEAAFHYLEADWTARQILADIAPGGSTNDSTNGLTTKIIFRNEKPKSNYFHYTDLSKPVTELSPEVREFLTELAPEMMAKPFDDKSILPYFPGYSHVNGVSDYKGINPKEGGFVYANPNIYGNVALLDVASMHPHSTMLLYLIGEYTKRYKEIVDARIAIKHKDWDKVSTMLDGRLAPYAKKVQDGEISSKQLANALKTAINSVYGLTSASFSNPFKDPRNVDNIVAKRGALFMIDLKEEVEKRGFTVAHIKTDSIKIPDATPEIISFVKDFGKRYGYTFEHEATYDKMCLVNDAVYIAKYDTKESCMRKYGYIPSDIEAHENQWVAVGTQFQVPYVFKYLFSKEPITAEDMHQTFSVNGALYLDMNERLPDVSELEDERKKLVKSLNSNLEKMEGLSKAIWISENNDGSESSEDIQKLKNELARLDVDSKAKKCRIEILDEEIPKGHDYHFVGKVGDFTPIQSGYGGGKLMREADGKYSAATGSTGYRWMETEMVRNLHLEDAIDQSYYIHLVDEAKKAISKYGDFEWFASEDRYDIPPEG